ncbi:fibronectin type III domain-containing protein [Actinoplanes xinjiangensis]|uniref:fibronectin type III domain-containing protein n=1 Tax=Actinoplanes xinjiangensis TaxID=512350 RepID=UPI00342E6358
MPAIRKPSRRAALAAVSTLLLTGLPAGPVHADTPDDLPAGVWDASCADADAIHCVEEARIQPTGAMPAQTPADLGLTLTVRTVSDGFGDWVDWSLAGLDDAPAAVRNGTVQLTINTGGFVPRYTDATAANGLSVFRSTATDGANLLNILGTPTAVHWNGDADCTAALSCGGADSTADSPRHVFQGRTQDLEGMPLAYITAFDGAIVNSDLQARPVLPTHDPDAEPPLSFGAFGNPQLTAAGAAVRNNLSILLPAAYFTAAGTTPVAAVATGFDVVALGDPDRHPLAVSTVQAGGVRVDLPALGLGSELTPLAVHYRPTPSGTRGLNGPGAPQSVGGAGAPGSVMVGWQAPAAVNGAPVTAYRARAWTQASGGTIAASCETTALTCTFTGLTEGGVYHVAVSAVNAFGEGVPAGRVAVLAATLPPPVEEPPVNPSPSPSEPPVTPSPEPTPEPSPSAGPVVPSAPGRVRLTPGPRRLTVSWNAPGSDGGAPITRYVAHAYRAATRGVPVATCEARGDAGSCVLTRLSGERLYVAVSAVNVAGRGPEPATMPAAAAWTVAGTPTRVAVTSDRGRVTAAWQAPGSNGGTPITGYRVDLSDTSGLVARCTNKPAFRDCTFRDGLTAGRTYSLRVMAVNAAGVSVPSQPIRIKVRG